MNMYLVTFNGYNSYGIKEYLIGLFDSEEKAKAAEEEAKRQIAEINAEDVSFYGRQISILEIPLNKKFTISKNMFRGNVDEGYKTDVLLASYEE